MTSLQGQFEPGGNLQEILDYQETLLREVNHRAKNSVAMAIGLLRLQKQRSRALRVRQALDQAIQRLHHLARIHELLSRQQDGGSGLIDMPTYLAEVCDGFSPLLADNVEIKLRAEPIELSAARAAPVALIVGEAVSNAIKHAFPRGRDGIVSVALSHDGDSISLTIEDDGVGKGTSRAGALGVRLMTEMARSLGGVITIESGGGTRVSTSFQLEGPYVPAGGADPAAQLRRQGSPVREIAPARPAGPARGLRD
jgi:two-component sensor histidine kinase